MTEIRRRRFLVDGIVQGVGFRPFVFKLAESEFLGGFVTNTSDGVVIEVEGPTGQLDRFAQRLEEEAPRSAKILLVVSEKMATLSPASGRFQIVHSDDTPGTSTLIPPDMAVCADCLREIRDPDDRRHGYPFTNCTNCGPRWSIIGRIPYDRPFTSMARFTMCPACRAEYEDPADRRFHAQPNACRECGPRLWLADGSGREQEGAGADSFPENPLTAAARLLARGKILAIKGLGGFHLAVRADDEAAVRRLRRRKHREAKPLAVMASAETIGPVAARVSLLLASPEAPIVLLDRAELHPDLAGLIAPAVAPNHRRLGLMLPYTPLHHLLLDALAENGGFTVVMTSGNASEEPICLDNDEAVQRLGGIADAWLLHDRDILRRADDSVVQVLEDQPYFFRRGRGYAPVPIMVRGPLCEGPPILAVGPELKNTVCLLKEDRAFLSPHIGNLENLQAYEFFTSTIATLQEILECEPGVIAHDMHPDYFSTKWSRERAQGGTDKTLIGVQHHHAHLVAVQAEHGLADPTIGLILDGTGYGSDGTLWGGEILIGDATGFERLAHFEPLALPGGEAAIGAPWRTAVSALRLAFGPNPINWPNLPFLDGPTAGNGIEPILEILDKQINCPLTSSCGRLFDAVAALTGRWAEVHYEAQAAIELMALTSPAEVAQAGIWPAALDETQSPLVLPVAPIIQAVCREIQGGASPHRISARFHATLIDLLTRAAQLAARRSGLTRVVLGGGVFQNEILLAGMMDSLAKAGLRPLRPLQTPANDGGIALGQALIARAALK